MHLRIGLVERTQQFVKAYFLLKRVEGRVDIGLGLDMFTATPIATIDAAGARVWLYFKQPSGRFYHYCKLFIYSLLILLLAMPRLHIQGLLVPLNLPARKFIVAIDIA